MNHDQFTPREREAWAYLAAGLPASEIAAAMTIAKGTVAGYMKALRVKTKARSLSDLVRMAYEFGIVETASTRALHLRVRKLEAELAAANQP